MNDNTLNSPSNNLEYVRRLYANVLDWYKNADLKANIILTIDGAFLTFVSTALFYQAGDIGRIPLYTLVLLGLMALTLFISLSCAIACIWSRIYRNREIDRMFKKREVDSKDYTTYIPSVSWFFQFISVLNKAEFEKKMRNLEPTFEIDAMASQIYYLSKNVREKHKYVNFGFVFTVITMVFFLASAATFLLYQQGIT